MHHKGEGMPQDKARAVTLYKAAADQGHAAAQSNLGLMHYDGEGMPQDKARAATLYEAAADQGHADAQFNLGCMHDKGNGVPLYHKTKLAPRRCTRRQRTRAMQWRS